MFDKMQLFDRISPQLYERLYRNVLMRLGGDREWAQDALQEGLAKAMNKRHQIKDESKFEHWISVIVKNQAVEELRTRATRRTMFINVENDVDFDYLPTKKSRSTEDIVIDKMEIDAFKSYVAGQSELVQQIFALREFDRVKFRDISKLLGIPLETVKSKYYRLLQQYNEAREK